MSHQETDIISIYNPTIQYFPRYKFRTQNFGWRQNTCLLTLQSSNREPYISFILKLLISDKILV
jgi:hypothetical protein